MSMFRIVGISSSPRRANTELLVKEALAAAEGMPDVHTEFRSFKGKTIHGCLDCRSCLRRREPTLAQQCVIEDDWRELISPLIDPVPCGVIIASPVYFFNVNAQLRAFMERCTSLMKGYWHPDYPHNPPDWSRTAAGALTVGAHRHGGQEHAINAIVQWLLTCGFVVVGSHSPVDGPIGYIGGAAWGSVRDDEWGIRSARLVGEKVARTAILLSTGASHSQMLKHQNSNCIREYNSYSLSGSPVPANSL